MSVRDLKWSAREKKIARAAYDKAYKMEIQRVQEAVYEKTKDFKEGNDVWRLHDYLTLKRREIEEKYDYRYSVLIFVFARLLREGLITEQDLEGLSKEKISKIKSMYEF
jgi:triphosphoribosyl-dephospho-CoA synthetase